MNTKIATISVAMLTLLLPTTPAISGEPKILPLRTALPSTELRLPSIPALSTMPWLGGWRNVCTSTRVWHQDYLADQGTLAGTLDRKGAS